MASKRNQRRKACGNKIKYGDKDAAFREALRLRRLYPGESIDGYPCPHGDHWHVGHRIKKVQQQIVARRKQQRRTA